MGHGRPPDHHAGHPGFAAAIQDVVRPRDVAVADHRNLHCGGNLRDHRPVRLAGISLLLGAAMHGDAAHAALLQDARGFLGIDGIPVPPDADLGRDRHRVGRLHHRLRHAGQQGAIPQQGRAPVFANDLVDRAAEIQIEKIRPHPVDDSPGRAGQPFRFPAKQLHPQRPLFLMKIEIILRAGIAVQDALGRDKFRGQNVRALRLAKTPEDGIRHARHGR